MVFEDGSIPVNVLNCVAVVVVALVVISAAVRSQCLLRLLGPAVPTAKYSQPSSSLLFPEISIFQVDVNRYPSGARIFGGGNICVVMLSSSFIGDDVQRWDCDRDVADVEFPLPPIHALRCESKCSCSYTSIRVPIPSPPLPSDLLDDDGNDDDDDDNKEGEEVDDDVLDIFVGGLELVLLILFGEVPDPSLLLIE